jgi:hypothetical protein
MTSTRIGVNMSTPASLTDVLEYILTHAATTDLDTIAANVKSRRATLATIASADVRVGARVRFHGLRPKYWNDLTGTVKEIESYKGKREAVVTLDKPSIGLLSASSTKYGGLWGRESYDVPGVPVTCLATLS